MSAPIDASLLLATLATVSEATLITDATGTVLYTNPAFATITGYSEGEILGRNCRMLQGPDTSPADLARLRTAVAAGEPYRGIIVNYRKDGMPFWNDLTINPVRDSAGILTNFVSAQRDITDILDEREKLSHDASHDQLTGLPNREALRRRMRRELSAATDTGNTVAIGMIDFDGFKHINDDYGHLSGDMVLIEFAKRVTSLMRPNDYFARLGGDEFVVVITDLSEQDALPELQGILARLHESVESPMEVDGRALVSIGMSMGVALFPKDALSGRDLIRCADAALYRAKSSPSRAHWWEAVGPQDVSMQLDQLPGELIMYMQPIVDLHTGVVHQVEALARILNADGVVETPDMFLPGLSPAQLALIFREGLDQSLSWLARWDSARVSLNVSVNLPPALLSNPESSTWVRDALRRHHIEPKRLGLELLETQELDLVASEQAVSELVRSGVKIHLDDLTSGFSTLKRITELPFDVVKIDRAIFNQVHERPLQVLTLLAAITKLGDDFGYGVVVEGIESRERLEMSFAVGANSGQGYLFAEPMPPEAIEGWVRAFVAPFRNGELTTPLGALAYHWTHAQGNGPQHPADCPLSDFITDPDIISLHARVHLGGVGLAAADAALTDALLLMVDEYPAILR